MSENNSNNAPVLPADLLAQAQALSALPAGASAEKKGYCTLGRPDELRSFFVLCKLFEASKAPVPYNVYLAACVTSQIPERQASDAIYRYRNLFGVLPGKTAAKGYGRDPAADVSQPLHLVSVQHSGGNRLLSPTDRGITLFRASMQPAAAPEKPKRSHPRPGAAGAKKS